MDAWASRRFEGGVCMEQGLVVEFETEQARFTLDGRVSVLDAIQVVTGSKCPALL